MIKRLSELEIGEHAIIKLVFGRGRMRTRMFDMGITPSAKVYFRKTAPMGDPMQISIRGYELTLRKSEAFHILVETNEKVDANPIDSKKKMDEFKSINEGKNCNHHFKHQRKSKQCCCKNKTEGFTIGKKVN